MSSSRIQRSVMKARLFSRYDQLLSATIQVAEQPAYPVRTSVTGALTDVGNKIEPVMGAGRPTVNSVTGTHDDEKCSQGKLIRLLFLDTSDNRTRRSC